MITRHAFISYSRRDRETVDHIVARLEKDGVRIWIDRRDIHVGTLWREEIVKAIRQSYACVLMLSASSVASENVRKEVDVVENSRKDLLPVLLAPVQMPDGLSYQLAGIQRIDYFADPEINLAELSLALQERQSVSAADDNRQLVELVIQNVNLAAFNRQQQEKLLDFIAGMTGSRREDLRVTTVTQGSLHVFVEMPADAAYRLETAALNRDARLLHFGVAALRLSGDRQFVRVKTGSLGPWKAATSAGPWMLGAIILGIVILLALLSFARGGVEIGFFSTNTPTATTTPTLTATSTASATPSATPTATWTFTPTPTFTPTLTLTPTHTSTPTNPPLAAPRPRAPYANQEISYFVGTRCPVVKFSWGAVTEADVTYTLHVVTDTGKEIISTPGIRGTSQSASLCADRYQWQVAATRISDGQPGPWSDWMPFSVVARTIRIFPIPTTQLPPPR